MTIFKISKIMALTAVSILALITTASAHGIHHRHHINYERDYTVVVVYTAPDPRIHKAVERKIVATKKREARLKRRLIRASLRL